MNVGSVMWRHLSRLVVILVFTGLAYDSLMFISVHMRCHVVLTVRVDVHNHDMCRLI